MNPDAVIANTQHWLQQAVIGLNLCPFAKAAYAGQRVRFVVSAAADDESLLQDLVRELEALHAADPAQCETTLLIHPQALADFTDYNEFLDAADAAIEQLELEGVIQIASFHPQYQFAGTTPGDVENCSNRSPYPMLHLLRESSVEAVVAATPDVEQIPQRNIATLRALGVAGWRKLMTREQ